MISINSKMEKEFFLYDDIGVVRLIMKKKKEKAPKIFAKEINQYKFQIFIMLLCLIFVLLMIDDIFLKIFFGLFIFSIMKDILQEISSIKNKTTKKRKGFPKQLNIIFNYNDWFLTDKGIFILNEIEFIDYKDIHTVKIFFEIKWSRPMKEAVYRVNIFLKNKLHYTIEVPWTDKGIVETIGAVLIHENNAIQIKKGPFLKLNFK